MVSALVELVLLAGSCSWGLGTYLPFAFLHLTPYHTLRLQRCPFILQNKKQQGNKCLFFVLCLAGMHYVDSLGPGTGGFATKRETGIDSVKGKHA